VKAMLSHALLLGGDADVALRHIEEALRISACTGEPWFGAELQRRLGCVLLCLDRPDPASAESEFLRALEICARSHRSSRAARRASSPGSGAARGA
jgi:hypothetical protein